jgi:sec-independent protein translocase protein TatB
MLDLAWPEVLVIGAVALVAIGPKDMPKALYALGRFAGKARRFAENLNRALDQVSHEAESADKTTKDNSSSPSPPPQ